MTEEQRILERAFDYGYLVKTEVVQRGVAPEDTKAYANYKDWLVGAVRTFGAFRAD